MLQWWDGDIVKWWKDDIMMKSKDYYFYVALLSVWLSSSVILIFLYVLVDTVKVS